MNSFVPSATVIRNAVNERARYRLALESIDKELQRSDNYTPMRLLVVIQTIVVKALSDKETI
jgi:hypothetical protein